MEEPNHPHARNHRRQAPFSLRVTLKKLLMLIFAIVAGRSWGSIALGGTATHTSSAIGANLTFSFTTGASSGSNAVLIVGANCDGSASEAVSGVTFNGNAMTFIGSTATAAANYTYTSLWYIKNPGNATTANVVVTYSGSPQDTVAGAQDYSGTDPFLPIGAIGKQSSDAVATSMLLSYTPTKSNSWGFFDFIAASTILSGNPSYSAGNQRWHERFNGNLNVASDGLDLSTGACCTPSYITMTSISAPSMSGIVAEMIEIQPTATATPSITQSFTRTPSFTISPTITRTSTQTATPTWTPTATQTATPVLASFVTSTQSFYANSPTITIPWTPSVSGVQELLCVMVGTNNTDNRSVITSMSYAGTSFVKQVQLASAQYSEGIELWTCSIGSYPYGGATSGNIVITQPIYNTINVDAVTVIEMKGAAQNSSLNASSIASLAQAQQSSTTSLSLTSLFQRSFIFSGYCGEKGIKTFPSGFTNLQYGHKYGSWGSVDYQGPVGPASYTASYVALPPYNPAAGVLIAEVPSYSYFTPSPTPTITQTPHP